MKDIEQLEQWLQKAKEDKDEQLPFVWEIMKSPFVEYHYSLCKDKRLDENFRRKLCSRFDEHHEAGQALLLSKLDKNEDADFHGEIIFMLGKLNDRRNRPDKEKVLAYVRALALSPDSYTRDRAIIVLGWIGTMEDIPLIADRLLTDENDKCRTWAAISFMQMWFRNKDAKLTEKVLPYLYQAITKEKDYFALGCIIETVQTITQKRFGLSQAGINSIDIEKIDTAKAKVEKYLKKLYNE